MLVVVRTPDSGSYLCMVQNGVEVARVRITVIDPEIINDLEAAEGIREGLKAWGDEDMPLVVAEESKYSVALKGKSFLPTLIGQGAASLSPAVFPWATDKEAHLAPRQVYAPNTEPFNPRGVLLHRLHLALEDYWRAPREKHALTRVRRNLMAVRHATQGRGTPGNWREMHSFADILLGAPVWQLLG